MLVSFVIPVFDEADSLRELAQGIVEHARPHECEIVFVDDGSRDRSLDVIKELAREHAEVRYIAFRRNFWKRASRTPPPHRPGDGFASARRRKQHVGR